MPDVVLVELGRAEIPLRAGCVAGFAATAAAGVGVAARLVLGTASPGSTAVAVVVLVLAILGLRWAWALAPELGMLVGQRWLQRRGVWGWSAVDLHALVRAEVVVDKHAYLELRDASGGRVRIGLATARQSVVWPLLAHWIEAPYVIGGARAARSRPR